MAKASTPSFIHELRLKVNPEQDKILSTRLEVGRQLYNACLGESMKRLQRMRELVVYQKARKLAKENKSARKQLFKQSREAVGFSEYALHKYLTQLYSNTWLATHIDSLSAQKIATRSFRAVEEYAYGGRGKPRFRGKNRFCSVEGKNNASGLRFIEGKIHWSAKGGKKVVLTPIYDMKDKQGVEAHALSCRTKYVRLVSRMIKGKRHWFAQLIQAGRAHIKAKNTVSQATVGLDIGPSSIAIVGDKQASLQAFCPTLLDYRNSIQAIQRKMSRSIRLNNAENYDNGVIKKGCKTWKRSKRYQSLCNQVSELQRKMAATRKCAHGQLVNTILRLGNRIQTEKLSYVGFQKNFGKSVGFRAPGMFLEMLRRKAESAGGEVIEFKTRATALSQTCHCGHKEKKPLNMRWHDCLHCGTKAQRDLYSAFLARFVKNNRLDTHQAQKAWPGADRLLEQAVSSLNKIAIGKARLASFGLNQSQSGSPAKLEAMPHEALDVVVGA